MARVHEQYMEMPLELRCGISEVLQQFPEILTTDEATQMASKAWHRKDLFAAPATRHGMWLRFFIPRGRIAKKREQRHAVWRPSMKGVHFRIFMVCPYRKCKSLLNLRGGEFQGNGYMTGMCIWCDMCQMHMWVVLEGYEQLWKLPMAREGG